MIKVMFSDGTEVNMEEGSKLSDAIKKAGYQFDFPCGGRGRCGKCSIKAGYAPNVEQWEDVLACSHELRQDIWVESPDPAGSTGAVILTGGSGTGHDLKIDKVPGGYGLAVDIGTTTVAGYLLNLATGEEAAIAAELNRQRVYGADVISRITAAQDSLETLLEMQRLTAETINSIIDAVSGHAGISPELISSVTLAGNTCMHHLLLGLNPKPLGRAPFKPQILAAVTEPAAGLGLKVSPKAAVWVFPVVSGFVGGDTVAAVLSTNLHKSGGIRLLVDIGTNGELVLNVNGRMTACSAAAGPALEGAQISCGMRAEPGAVSKVRIAPDIKYEVIGGSKPRGICGSGLIDMAGELIRNGVITKKGGIVKPGQFEGPSYLRERILPAEMGHKFVLVPPEEKDGVEISLTQDDILQIQLAKGALHASMELLVQEAGITGDRVEQVLLAGAFGNFMDRDQALEIGLFPPWASDKIVPVGNAAGEGAKAALLSVLKREEAELISREIGFREFAGTTDFSDAFINGIIFRNAR